MTPSENCLSLIKQSEGCKLNAYQDSVGVWTIGYGCTGPDIIRGLTWTQDQAESELEYRVSKFGAKVIQLVTVPLNQNQFDALTDFCYNLGAGALESSTLLKLLNQGQYSAVPDELMKWVKAGGKVLPGLVARRQAEANLWIKESA